MQSYNIINGNFVTLNPQLDKVTSITVNNGKVETINQINNTYKTFNLNGASLFPGFIDSHFHLKNFGKRLQMLNLKGLKNIQEIINKIEEKLIKLRQEEWLIGFGWDQNLWDIKTYPDAHILNNLSSNNPIYLTRIDGHAAWVNNSAIIKTGHRIKEISKQEGGTVINDCIMIDNAMNIFKQYLPSDNKQQVKRWIKVAASRANQMGITGVHDAWQDKITIQAIKELIAEGEFPIRCYGMLAGSDSALLQTYFDKGHYHDDYLSIRSVKAFIDGALGSRGAALHEPYCDDNNNCGLILISKEEFQELAIKCYANNFQLNTHAIGDRGNSYVLDCYAHALDMNLNRRWRIEHAQMVSDDDMSRFKKHAILPSMQPSHCTSDMPWLQERIGMNRLKLISRWKSFIDLGLKIPGGSDCPIESGNPLFEFYAAITRQNHQGLPKDGWQSQEKVKPLEALKMFTSWAAFGGFDEHRRGQIAMGYDADFTVLSDNPLIQSPSEVLNIKVIYTIVNGRIVYSNL